MLSKKAITDYQEIYKKEFGIEINDQEAKEQGMRLLKLFKLIYQPIPKAWLKQQTKKREK